MRFNAPAIARGTVQRVASCSITAWVFVSGGLRCWGVGSVVDVALGSGLRRVGISGRAVSWRG